MLPTLTPVAEPTAGPLPEGRRAVLGAIGSGAVTTFSLTHNPLFQALIVPGIITFITGPFLGGMMAAGKARLGFASSLLVALAIAIADAGPFIVVLGVAWAIIEGNPMLVPDRQLIFQIFSGLLWAIAGVSVYAFVTGLLGVWFGIRARRREHAQGSR